MVSNTITFQFPMTDVDGALDGKYIQLDRQS